MEMKTALACMAALALILAGCAQQPSAATGNVVNSGGQDNGDGTMGTGIVETGDTVKVEYVGTFTDGNIFDKSEGGAPLEFVVDGGGIIPGFNVAVKGLKLNDEKNFSILPEQAYGPVNEEAKIWVPKTDIPSDINLSVGLTLMSQNGPVTIIDMNADSVKIDFNHPMAGKTLNFWIKVVGITKAAQ